MLAFHLDEHLGRLTVRDLRQLDDAHLEFANQSIEHAGIAYAPRGSRTIGQIVRNLCLMNDCLEPADVMGKVEFL